MDIKFAVHLPSQTKFSRGVKITKGNENRNAKSGLESPDYPTIVTQ